MFIKVDNLNNGYSENIEFQENVTLPNNKKVFVDVKGKITNSYGKYTFEGDISSKVFLQCDVCLDEFQKEICFHMTEIFSKTETGDEIWNFSSKNNLINLEEPIVMNILLNLPMKSICSKNCKGLCRICGHNLNKGECGCERDFIDPRFEEFLNIFKNKED